MTDDQAARRERALQEFTAWEAARSVHPSTPPPGWYPDSVVPETERYWTGTKWSDVTRPLVQPKPDSSFAWALIAVPLVPVLVALTAPKVYGSGDTVAVLAFALNVVFAIIDARRVQALGYRDDTLLAALLVPVYLIVRTRKVGSSIAIPILWFVTFGLSLAALATFARVYDYSGDVVGQDVGHQLSQQLGGHVTVKCPDMAGLSGAAYTCSAQDNKGNVANVDVTLGGSGYVWQLATNP